MMRFPVIVYRTANGYITSPVALGDEVPPDPEEMYSFQSLDQLHEYMLDLEEESDQEQETRPIGLLPDEALDVTNEEEFL